MLVCLLNPFPALTTDYNIGSYTNFYTGKSCSVDVRLKKDVIKIVYIYMATKSGATGYFAFNGKDLEKFYEALNSMRNKFIEWSGTAIENNISSFSKEFEVKLPKGNFFWIGTKTWFSSKQPITPIFTVADGKPMIMLIGSASALQNKYISETFYLVINNLENYDAFIEIFNPENALKKALHTQNLTDKFK